MRTPKCAIKKHEQVHGRKGLALCEAFTLKSPNLYYARTGQLSVLYVTRR